MKNSIHKYFSDTILSFTSKQSKLFSFNFDGLLDLFYPHRCPSCNIPCKKPEIFCPTCRVGIEPIVEPLCPRCFIPYESGESHLCNSCRLNPPPFERAVAVFRYGGEIATAIQKYKYGGQVHLGRPLGSLLRHHLKALNPEIITPVPLDPVRLSRRGFNQSFFLIKGAARKTNSRLIPRLLMRVHRGSPQASKTISERKKLKSSVFGVRYPKLIKNRRVLLVDDVMTTGATARACSQAIIKAGAESVSVLVLARTVR